MDIIYMGSGNFAVAPLSEMLRSDHKVAAVFTAPPLTAKKGGQFVKNTLHEFAESKGLNVYTPVSLKSEEALRVIDATDADIIVVASYGQILTPRVLKSKVLGAINIHPSALPRFRGPSPLQHTILSGDKASTVCIIKMDSGVDTGPILLKSSFCLEPGTYFHQLESQASKIGASLLIQVLNNFKALVPVPQDESLKTVSYAKIIKKIDGRIDWTKPADVIERMVRAFAGWPGSFFLYKEEQVKIFKAEHEKLDIKHDYLPGTVVDSNLGIACGEGILRPTILQRAGKRAIFLDAFLRGFSIKEGERLH
jgi:methionyl-tRNA formyltransferase